VPVISIGRLAGFTNRRTERTIVPVDIPGSKWWKHGDKPPAMPSASLTRQEAERIAREHEEAKQYRMR